MRAASTLTAREAAILNHLAIPAAPPATASLDTIPDFVFAYLKADRGYDTSEYPVAGIFDQTTTPWLNDINLVPSYNHWTLVDVELRGQRLAQINAENQYAKTMVPGQIYKGNTAEQVRQRFSLGMFDPKVFAQSQIDALTQFWIDDDAEFGRRPLGGANPNAIAMYPGSASKLDQLLTEGGAHDLSALSRRLERARSDRKLFWCDYTGLLGPVEHNRFIRNGQYWTVPMVFYLYDATVLGLMPAAIQLRAGGYWFTPADDANSWLLAKLYAACADTQSCFSGTHLYHTHSVAMIFGIAALKLIAQGTLSLTHPILMLVNPHLVKVYDVNTKVYNVRADPNRPFDPVTNPLGIYQKGQFCDQHLPTGRIGVYQMISSLYSSYSFDDNAFDSSIATRGLDSRTLPGIFPYRDDGQIWWRTLQLFTKAVVDACYSSDAAVVADQPLNEWLCLVEQTFNRDGTKRFTWKPTRDYLASALTHLSFLTTAQHTAVNVAMFDAYAFIPNGPFAMTAPSPAGPGVSDEQVLRSLPDPQNSEALQSAILGQINMLMVATPEVTYRAAAQLDASALHAMFPYDRVTQPALYRAVADFHEHLVQAKGAVESNRQTRIDHYRRQHPDAATIPNSVCYPYLSVERVMACIQS